MPTPNRIRIDGMRSEAVVTAIIYKHRVFTRIRRKHKSRRTKVHRYVDLSTSSIVSDFKDCINFSHDARVRSISFPSFLRENRFRLLICSVAVAAFYLIISFSINVYYFYSLMNNDPLYYYFHAWYLFHQHTTVIRFAENLKPFYYVGLPGYIRIPILALSNKFAVQLRIIQVSNIITVLLVGILTSYLMHVCVPRIANGLSIPITFGMLLMSSTVEYNVFLPMGDMLFAIFTCGTIIAIRSAHDLKNNRRLRITLILVSILLPLAVAVKYLALLIPVYGFLCWIPAIDRKHIKGLIAFAVLGCVLLLCCCSLFWETIFAYATTWLHRISVTRWYDWILNLLTISIPSVIIPPFYYLYSRKLTVSYLTYNWLSSLRDVMVEIGGGIVTGIVMIGMYKARKALMPEIVLIVLVVPIVSPITTSTIRYFQTFQYLMVAFFCTGVISLLLSMGLFRNGRRSWGVLSVTVLLAVMMVTKGAGVLRRNLSSISEAKKTMESVSSTYRNLDRYLGSLDANRSYVLYFAPETRLSGKWQVLRGLRYIAPDASLPKLSAKYDVYVVFDHNLKRSTRSVEEDNEDLASLSRWGKFRLDPVFDSSNDDAIGRVYRVRLVDNAELH